MHGEGMTAVITLLSNIHNNAIQIGSMLVSGKKLYYAAAGNKICALHAPLHFDWTSTCQISNVILTSSSCMVRRGTECSQQPEPNMHPSHGQYTACSPRDMERLHVDRVIDAGSFFWNLNPVSDKVEHLDRLTDSSGRSWEEGFVSE